MEDHPISRDSPGGGPVTMYSRLELMAHSGVEIHLVILSSPWDSFGFDEYVKQQPEVWKRVRGWCKSYTRLHLVHLAKPSPPSASRYLHRVTSVWARLRRILLALKDPAPYVFAVASSSMNMLSAFRQVATQVRPDVIWAENIVPAVLAWRATSEIPLIYGFHDWVASLLKLKNRLQKARTWRSDFMLWLSGRVEQSLVQQVAGCVSACARELEEVTEINSKPAAYFPVTYSLASPPAENAPTTPARIVHVGGMGTVANRLGLERFLDVTWPIICRNLGAPPELWIIGSMKGAPESLVTKIKEAGIVPVGFVQDLGSVLRPYDLHIIPWEHDTGARARIPLILNHAQVAVSTRAAAASQPEIEDGKDCVLVDDLEQMGQAILALLSDGQRRREIGQAARQSFMKHFTREAVQPHFDQFIDGLRLGKARAAVAAERVGYPGSGSSDHL